MPTAAALLPAARTSSSPPPRRSAQRGRPLLALLRCLTVLVGLATAAITLGPRALVVDGRSTVEGWLPLHPVLAQLVDRLGGVEPAGNLLLFVPFAALLALSVRLRFLPVAFLLLAGAPIAVEWAQRFLPGRVPDGNDVVSNSIGLLTAFTVVGTLRLLLRGLDRLLRAGA